MPPATLSRFFFPAAAALCLSCASAGAQDATQPDKSPARGGVNVGAEDADKTGKFPALTGALAQRGAAAISKRNWTEARKAYEEMLAAEPDNAMALANLGTVEYQLKDYEAAAKHLEAAARQRPGLSQTWLTLGMLYMKKGDQMMALSAASRAVHEKPDDPRNHSFLAVVTKGLGWSNAAEAELQKALELDPKYAEAHFNLSLMYMDRKPPAVELARRHYERAVELGADKDALMEKQLAEAAKNQPKPEPDAAEKKSNPPEKVADKPAEKAKKDKPKEAKPKK